MVIHPTEQHRKDTLESLHHRGSSPNPQLHITLNQLLRLLHVDFRLPVLLDDEASSFMGIHKRCAVAAEQHKFPLLHTGANGNWTMKKTQRLQHLHGHLSSLLNPFDWENNPGIDAYEKILRSFEREHGGTLPVLLPRHVLGALDGSDTVPFHFSHLDGILLLDHAPDFTELERAILISLSRFIPVHQLINPGSFRLGHHGAFLVDEYPCDQESLPSWVPQHTVWTPSDDSWRSPIGFEHDTNFTRIAIDDRAQIVNAAVEFIDQYRRQSSGRVLIIDGAARDRAHLWSQSLATLGIQWNAASDSLDGQPLFHALLQAARLSQGMSAWGLNALYSMMDSTSLPLAEDMYPDLLHPTEESWRPRPHQDILQGMAQQFHVLGGPGAISRWVGALSRAKPSATDRNPREREQALEETQWWISCLLHSWKPLLMGEDIHMLKYDVSGCSSGAGLPLPPSPDNGTSWLIQFVKWLDFDELSRRKAPFDRSLGTFHTLLESIQRIQSTMKQEGVSSSFDGTEFIELLTYIGQITTLSSTHIKTSGIEVLTPKEAIGLEADLIILAGLDVDAWVMKSSVVPWLDAKAQLELGMFQTDLLIRQGRHHIKHLLNAAPMVVMFDSTHEDGGGPSAPFGEWLADVRRSGEWDAMRSPPPFIPTSTYQGESPSRRWEWKSRELGQGSWLCPRTSWVADEDGKRRTIRHGPFPRDARQQLGMDLKHSIQPRTTSNHSAALINSFEASIQNDRKQREPSLKAIEAGTSLSWEHRSHLLHIDTLNLRPTHSSSKAPGSTAAQWPHLGHREEKVVSLSVDPRPLPAYSNEALSMNHRFGMIDASLNRGVWSPSRLEKWLQCPRGAWVTQFLHAQNEDEGISEDVDFRIRGILAHEVAGALLTGHGVSVSGPDLKRIEPLHQGPMGDIAAGWDTILAYLNEHVQWLGRHNAVSVHRTRDLIDATPAQWNEYQESGEPISPRGRLFRMYESDLTLEHAAPIACEWKALLGKKSVTIDASDDNDQPSSFEMFGYADRVDVVVLNEEQQRILTEAGLLDVSSESPKPAPLDGTPYAAKRLVIIRDLKTVRGPAIKKRGLRHLRCLFEELQLALYARAWEITHPGDRVIGVGATEIGELTTHYVELDDDIASISEELQVGVTTRHLPLHFPSFEAKGQYRSSFRTWMYERLKTAQRGISAANGGQVNPTPGTHCNYCVVRQSCSVSSFSGGSY